MKTTYIVFQSKKDKQWYWREEAGNNKITAVGGQGYSRKYRARAATVLHVWRIRNTDVKVITRNTPQ